MPQFDPATFSPQLFWLVVSFAVLFVVMWRYGLPRVSRILEARQERIDSDLEKAVGLKEDADRVIAEYEAALAEARGRAVAAVKKASDEMAAESARRHGAFGRELAQRTKEAEERIAAAKEAALANLGSVAAEVAVAATAKLIDVRPSADQVEGAVKGAMRGRG